MGVRRTGVTLVMASLVSAGAASAQSAYVAGAIGAEVVRTTATKAGGSTFDSGSGDAVAGAIRVGTYVTRQFGVELEFFRPGEITADSSGPIYYAALDQPILASLVQGSLAAPPDLGALSIIGQTVHVRATTTSALAFARQTLGDRVELVYLGGIGFSRVVHEVEYGFRGGITPLARPIVQPYSTRTTQYGAGPVAGVEVRVGMTEHAQVTAGLRMHALGQSLVDGWMIRPSVGLAWKF